METNEQKTENTVKPAHEPAKPSLEKGRSKSAAAPKTRGRFAAFSFGLILLLAALVAGIWNTANLNAEYEARLNNVYQRSFYEYSEAVANIELNLSKMIVSNTPEYGAELATQTYRHASVAHLMLTQLPYSEAEIAETGKFLNQVGDWCLSYSRTLLNTTRDAGCYRDQIEELYIVAADLNTRTLNEGMNYRAGGFNNMSNLWKNRLPNTAPVTTATAEETVSPAVEYPEMIYDGPFSDSRCGQEFKTLKDCAVLSEAEVSGAVKDRSVLGIKSLTLRGQSECKARCYEYEAETENGAAYLSASEYGGKVLNFSRPKNVSEIKLSDEYAKTKAREYALALGFDAEPVWYNRFDGVAVVSLAPVKDDTVFYPDLVKVKIALDDGALLGLEAKNFSMNHCERGTFAKMKPDAAKSMLSKNLTVHGCRKALVPVKDGGEELCYELACEYKGLDYLVYLSASDGREIDVLRVVDTEQGPMTY